jgi:apolipoprotein N-acyltransferase
MQIDTWQRPAMLALIAALALALGIIVYVTDRDTSRAMLIPSIATFAGSKVFGALGQWLPSFLHTFAFSLFTAAVLAPRSVARYGACIAWGAINVGFEVGQHPLVSARLGDALRDRLVGWPLVEPLNRYFVRGTFDWGDIAAALFGASVAGAVLHFTRRDQEDEHAH